MTILEIAKQYCPSTSINHHALWSSIVGHQSPIHHQPNINQPPWSHYLPLENTTDHHGDCQLPPAANASISTTSPASSRSKWGDKGRQRSPWSCAKGRDRWVSWGHSRDILLNKLSDDTWLMHMVLQRFFTHSLYMPCISLMSDLADPHHVNITAIYQTIWWYNYHVLYVVCIYITGCTLFWNDETWLVLESPPWSMSSARR